MARRAVDRNELEERAHEPIAVDDICNVQRPPSDTSLGPAIPPAAELVRGRRTRSSGDRILSRPDGRCRVMLHHFDLCIETVEETIGCLVVNGPETPTTAKDQAAGIGILVAACVSAFVVNAN